MTTRRKFLVGAAAGGVGLALAACAPGSTSPTTAPASASPAARPKTGGTLTLGNQFDIGNIDPATSAGSSGSFFELQVHDKLFRADHNLKIQPWLVERWTAADDQKSLTLFLRKGVTYHDGTPFDAASVKWNLDRYKTNPKSVHTAALAPLDHVEIVDASTVKLVLSSPFAPLLTQLTTQTGFMSSQKEVESQGATFGNGLHKAGSGPFMLQEIVPNDHITLVKNPNWWGKDSFGGQLPYLDKVVVKVIPDSAARFTNVRTGAVDVIFDITKADIATARAEAGLAVKSVPSTEFYLLFANHKPGFVFNDSRNVKAVAMALDRSELVRVAYGGSGQVAYGPIAPQHQAFDPAFKPYDPPNPDGAKQLIAQIGKGPLSFEILYYTGDSELLQAMQLIQAQLKKADITVTLRGVPAAQSSAEFRAGTFPGMYTSNLGGTADPDTRFLDVTHSAGRLNFGKYANPMVDTLIAQERATFDDAQRKDIFRKLQQIVVVDDPAAIWNFYGTSYLVLSKKLNGLEPDPLDAPSFETAWFS